MDNQLLEQLKELPDKESKKASKYEEVKEGIAVLKKKKYNLQEIADILNEKLPGKKFTSGGISTFLRKGTRKK
tara:strand:+ start:354 stop:572 length:219 start_codon:yes stop_codon:yes gene_type:complete